MHKCHNLRWLMIRKCKRRVASRGARASSEWLCYESLGSPDGQCGTLLLRIVVTIDRTLGIWGAVGEEFSSVARENSTDVQQTKKSPGKPSHQRVYPRFPVQQKGKKPLVDESDLITPYTKSETYTIPALGVGLESYFNSLATVQRL